MSDKYYKLEGGQQGTKLFRHYTNFLPKSLRKHIDGLFFITLAFVVFSVALTISMIVNIIVLNFQLIHTGTVVSDVYDCSEMGVSILKKGGSGVDAAIVTMLCMGLYSPMYSGIGGGGFMVVFKNADDMTSFNFREKAPLTASENMFVGKPDASQKGGLSVAIPGEISGMEAAHNKYGKLSWSELFQPVITAAENGTIVSPYLAAALKDRKSELEFNSVFLKEFCSDDGTPLQAGDILKRPSLAKALRIIQTEGSAGFYTGPIAEEIISYVNAHNGNISKQDLGGYSTSVSSVISTHYKGYKVISHPLPSGGPAVLYCFNILNNQLFNSTPTGWDYHRIIEAFKYTYAERMQFGDPLFVHDVNLTKLVADLMEEDTGRAILAKITDSTYNVSHYGDVKQSPSNHGTTHISVLDSNGMAVSITTSVNLYFGSALITPTYGIILNDDMDDFSTPNTNNFFNLPPSPHNFIAPTKQAQSSMSPVIVLDKGTTGREYVVHAVSGGSGGSHIITAVVQALLNTLSFGMYPDEAVKAKRLHNQLIPQILNFETGFPELAVDILRSIYSRMDNIIFGDAESTVDSILTNRGEVWGASDPRKGGKAAFQTGNRRVL
ncbi:hypothetical protein LOD99_2022 [Oopsacas minuta]|uniref:Gamma-glutamyltranspeptidase 1 n=1 Tax=Oopsacas minuta TaxID=111878 RepID=A0AAV7K419_9METZ|nr:hypothetical protein LOD99_2022 [Oopsacas minuta]